MDKLKIRNLLEELRRECVWQLDDCLMDYLARYVAVYLANPGIELPQNLHIPLTVSVDLEPFWPKFASLTEKTTPNAEMEALWPGDSGLSSEADDMMAIIDRHIMKSLREEHKKRLEKAVKDA